MIDTIRKACVVSLLALSACGPQGQGWQAAGTEDNWPGHGGAQDESGYSRLQSIDTKNVTDLGLAWSLDLPGEASLEATPLAIEGILYFTGSMSTVYAVNARNGRILWQYNPDVPGHNPVKQRYTMPVNRGAAYADGKILSGTLDGRLIALDAKTGKLAWSVETVERGTFHTSTGAPRVFKNMVIIGNGGGDFGARGYVTAYDIKTGQRRWRFYTVPGSPDENRGDPAMERAASTWSGEYWKTGTGGTAWNGITFDPDLNQIYIGTGNAGPYDPKVRSPGDGDNLYIASVVALNADTGKYVWHYQVNPREAWDFKATANMIASTIEVDGKPRKVLMQAPTNGFFYVLDRQTGKLISADKIGKVTWASRIDLKTGRPVENPNIRYETGDITIWPSNLGAHNWQDMSYSPRSGLAYIPYMHLSVHFHKGPAKPGEVSYGGLSISYPKTTPEDGTGALVAYDPQTQKTRWRVPLETMWNGGTLATAGGLVFQGTGDGYFTAYDAGSGKRLWRFYAGLGIIAAPISYAVDGKQNVSILVGYGGSASINSKILDVGWKFNSPRRLLTFAVGGKATLPPSPARNAPLVALDDPALKIAEPDILAGKMVYTANCAVCHGLDVRSAGAPAPDLRESAIALRSADLTTLLHEGPLQQSGMPQFKDISDKDARLIHAYIRAKAREALGLRKPLLNEKPAGPARL